MLFVERKSDKFSGLDTQVDAHQQQQPIGLRTGLRNWPDIANKQKRDREKVCWSARLSGHANCLCECRCLRSMCQPAGNQATGQLIAMREQLVIWCCCCCSTILMQCDVMLIFRPLFAILLAPIRRRCGHHPTSRSGPSAAPTVRPPARPPPKTSNWSRVGHSTWMLIMGVCVCGREISS